MKQILNIYQTDIKNIVKNWVALVVILGLVFLPSLYAWFNIKAAWDPYGQTSQLKVAVVNNDYGAKFRGETFNFGKETIASLKKNKKIGWKFMSESVANRGVSHGEYYASIIIPEDFSEKIFSVISNNPQKATIIYNVNEKINAIAPKITAKGASSIVEQVSSNFVYNANNTIFKIFNKLGLELETEKPAIEEMEKLVLKVEAITPELSKMITLLIQDMDKADQLIHKGQDNLTIITNAIINYQNFINQLGGWVNKGKEGAKMLAPNIKNNLILMQEAATEAYELSSVMADPAIESSKMSAIIEGTAERLAIKISALETLINLFEQMNQIVGENQLSFAAEKIKKANSNLEEQLTLMNNFKEQIVGGNKITLNQVSQLTRLTNNFSVDLEEIISRYDSEIMPLFQQGLANIKASSAKAMKILGDVNEEIPDIQGLLHNADQGLMIGTKEIKKIQSRLPIIEEKIHRLGDFIRQMEKEGTIDELIAILKLNANKESEFFAEPVVLKENKLFPIPNYGSAMSPFFTTLSLWVGALLLVSLLTVEVNGNTENYKSYEIYFGRFFTFMSIAVLQAFIVTIGDIFLLKAYVVNKFWFVIFGILLSCVFMLIVYTFVSLFGNLGKAVSIVLLVLQLAGSGGTFPIQVTGPFFQKLYPFLPFTYAISMMREAVGGILWDIIFHDIFRLAIFACITLVFGVSLKKYINQLTAELVMKAKASKLIH